MSRNGAAMAPTELRIADNATFLLSYTMGARMHGDHNANENHEGACTCRAVRYRLTSRPLFVHCCHCRWCQRETGSAFAINAMIEAERVELLEGAPEIVDTPSNSGKGHRIARCATCRI